MKKFLALIAALALLASLLVLPAGAYYLCEDGYSIYANMETQKFWDTHRTALDAREIYALSADNSNFCGEFHDGLLLVHEAVTVPADRYPGLNDNYVNKNGELVDLNRNRYDLMYAFSGGYAAAAQWHAWADEGERGGVAYVNTAGQEVVPFNKEWTVFRLDLIDYTGRFENGRALVVREIPGEGPFSNRVYSGSVYSQNWDQWRGIEYAYIDATGKLITGWTRTDDPNVVTKLPLYDRTGVWIGYRHDAATWASADWSYEAMAADMASGGSGSSTPTTPAQPVPPEEYQRPDLPDYPRADTSFQSHARITDYTLGDMDMGSFILTVTNNTDGWDGGVVAVAAANVDGTTGSDSAGVFFVPYLVGPHASQEVSVNILGIIHQEMFGFGINNAVLPSARMNAAALEGRVSAKVIHFESDADLREFYELVPYEQGWSAGGVPSEFRPVCSGAAGTQFLRALGISRPNTESGGHSDCQP